jgi:hypothetical protein
LVSPARFGLVVVEIENTNRLSAERSLFIKVVFPAPEGALMTIDKLFAFKIHQPIRDGLGLHCGQDNMIAVHDDYCPGFSSVRGVDEKVILLRFIPQSLSGCRCGGYNNHDPLCNHGIAESDVYQCGFHFAFPHARFRPLTVF